MQKNTAKIIYFICSAVMMLIIFAFSSQNFEDTTNTSNIIVKPLQKAAESSIHKSFGDETERENYISKVKKNIDVFIRKGAHVFLFSFLALFIFLLKKQYCGDHHDCVMFTLIFCFLYGCFDEIHQKFVPRTANFRDVCLDLFGAFLMMVIIDTAKRIGERKKSKAK